MSAIKVSQDYSFTFEKGTTWGTAVSSTPSGIPTEDMDISIEATSHEIMRAYGIRGLNQDNFWQDTDASIPTAKFSAPATEELLVALLPGVLQSSTPYSKSEDIYTMFSKNYSSLPNPALSEGYFYTLVRNSPVASDDILIKSAVPKSVKLTCDVKDKNGILNSDWEFIGRNYVKNTTSAGTISHLPLTSAYRFSNITTASFSSYDLKNDLVSFEVNISNGAKFVNDLPSGGVVFPKWEITGNIKVLAGSHTEAMKDLILSNTASNAKELKIEFGSGLNSNEEMQILSQCYLTKWSSDYKEGEVITFEFKGVFTTTGYPIQIKLVEVTV